MWNRSPARSAWQPPERQWVVVAVPGAGAQTSTQELAGGGRVRRRVAITAGTFASYTADGVHGGPVVGHRHAGAHDDRIAAHLSGHVTSHRSSRRDWNAGSSRHVSEWMPAAWCSRVRCSRQAHRRLPSWGLARTSSLFRLARSVRMRPSAAPFPSPFARRTVDGCCVHSAGVPEALFQVARQAVIRRR